MHAIRDTIQHRIMDGFRQIADWAATATRLRTEHRAVLDAIVAGRPEEASAAVRGHIALFYRDYAAGR